MIWPKGKGLFADLVPSRLGGTQPGRLYMFISGVLASARHMARILRVVVVSSRATTGESTSTAVHVSRLRRVLASTIRTCVQPKEETKMQHCHYDLLSVDRTPSTGAGYLLEISRIMSIRTIYPSKAVRRILFHDEHKYSTRQRWASMCVI